MKETPLSNCERDFLLETIKNNHRLDGRKNDEFRKITIHFGGDWGSALVTLGETKVLCQVSCDLGVPKAVRPNEGMMLINVELGPMAAPHFEAGRNSNLLVQLNRTLERTFKDSKCVDLESLCVMAEEKVWILRVDLNVINHEGNLIDCCSVAALAALGHFRRPDVSIIENEVHIHTAAEKDPIPLVLHHYPICVTYCTFDEGNIALADPTYMEERVANSTLIFGLNSYRELCCLNLGGSTLTSTDLLLKCAHRAAKHAQTVVTDVKKALALDLEERESGKHFGFKETLHLESLQASIEDHLMLKLRNFSMKETKPKKEDKSAATDGKATPTVGSTKKKKKQAKKDVATCANKPNLTSWLPEEKPDQDPKDDEADIVEMSSFDEKSVTEQIEESTRIKNRQKDSTPSEILPKISSTDSEEEEEVVML